MLPLTKKRKTAAGLTIMPNPVVVNLPVDMIAEILVRLPVKSLLRFKCLGKSWYSLIKSPKFVDLHLRYTSSAENYSAILKRSLCRSSRIHVSYLPDMKDETMNLSVDDPRPLPLFDDFDDELGPIDRIFTGSCNGIICLSCDHCSTKDYRQGDLIALWNPETRETKILPLSNTPRGNTAMEGTMEIGFGFDLKSRDYKVVRILDYVNESRWNPSVIVDRTIQFHPLVEVYSLSTNCWRKIDVVVPSMRMAMSFTQSTYLDGFYYWWSRGDSGQGRKVLTFDFANEVFTTIDPPYIERKHSVILVKYKDSIALFAGNSELSNREPIKALWVLSRDGEKDTWSKLFQIRRQFTRLVGSFRNGNTLEVYKYRDNEGEGWVVLKQYDPSSRQIVFWKVLDSVMYDESSVQLVSYVPSLVSLNEF